MPTSPVTAAQPISGGAAPAAPPRNDVLHRRPLQVVAVDEHVEAERPEREHGRQQVHGQRQPDRGSRAERDAEPHRLRGRDAAGGQRPAIRALHQPVDVAVDDLVDRVRAARRQHPAGERGEDEPRRGPAALGKHHRRDGRHEQQPDDARLRQRHVRARGFDQRLAGDRLATHARPPAPGRRATARAPRCAAPRGTPPRPRSARTAPRSPRRPRGGPNGRRSRSPSRCWPLRAASAQRRAPPSAQAAPRSEAPAPGSVRTRQISSATPPSPTSTLSRCSQWMCCSRTPSRNGTGAWEQPGQLVQAVVESAATTYEPASITLITSADTPIASRRTPAARGRRSVAAPAPGRRTRRSASAPRTARAPSRGGT